MNRPSNGNEELALLLRLVGGVELCAIPFVLFPLGWMSATHAHLLRLGELPPGPIVEYLARCLSALYAVHGATVVRLSFDVPRFRPLIGFLGYLHVAFGLTVFLIDLTAGLPVWWVMGEGPGIATGGVLVLVLAREPRG